MADLGEIWSSTPDLPSGPMPSPYRMRVALLSRFLPLDSSSRENSHLRNGVTAKSPPEHASGGEAHSTVALHRGRSSRRRLRWRRLPRAYYPPPALSDCAVAVPSLRVECGTGADEHLSAGGGGYRNRRIVSIGSTPIIGSLPNAPSAGRWLFATDSIGIQCGNRKARRSPKPFSAGKASAPWPIGVTCWLCVITSAFASRDRRYEPNGQGPFS